MADRSEIARRHGIPHLADQLVGDTPESLEADAAARAAIIGMLTPQEPDEQPPEPVGQPVEGLPPKDKPVHEYTEQEWQASHEAFERTMRERARREQVERREEEERQRAEANRTDEQRFGDAVVEALRLDAKRARDASLIRSLGLGEGDER